MGEPPRRTRRGLSDVSRDHVTARGTSVDNSAGVVRAKVRSAVGQGHDQDNNNDADDDEEALVVTPATPRPTRVLSAPKTPKRSTQKAAAKGSNDREVLQAILGIVEGLKERNSELQQELGSIKIELSATKKQLAEVKTQLETLTKLVQARDIRRPRNGTEQSWASIAALPQDNQVQTRANHVSGPVMTNREKVVSVTLGRTATRHKDSSLDELKSIAEKELAQQLPTAQIQILGINRAALERIDLTMETKEQANTVRENADWVKGFGEDAKVRQATWYPIKLDGVPKEVLCTREGNGWDFKADAAQILGGGNSQEGERFGVKKLHWLSKPTAKLEGSLVVYVDSWTAAQQILSKKEFTVGPSLAGARAFVQQQQPPGVQTARVHIRRGSRDPSHPSTTVAARQGMIKILTDCQSAIKSLERPQQQSGQYLIQEILEITAELRSQGTKITLQWVPAHEGIHGNELAHKWARQATKKGCEVIDEQAPRLKSQAYRVARDHILKERDLLFRRTLAGKFTRSIDKALPRDHMAKIYKILNRQDTAILVQLRTGHVGLNDYMARIHRADSAACSCGAEAETVSHFLFHCPLWDGPRQELQQVLGDRRSDLSYALGGWSGRIERRTGKHVDGNRDQCKPEIMAIEAVIQFVKATGRLHQRQSIDMEDEGGQRGSSG